MVKEHNINGVLQEGLCGGGRNVKVRTFLVQRLKI